MQTRRVPVAVAAAAALALPAGIIDSSNGNATVAPIPRRNVRRARCFPVMYDIVVLLVMVSALPLSSLCQRPALLSSSETHRSLQLPERTMPYGTCQLQLLWQ